MMTASFDGRDELGLSQQLEALQRENHKLRTIRDALMQRADGENDLGRAGYMLVQPVIDVETGVERRIKKLARAVSEAKIARRQLQQAVDAIAEGFILYDAEDRIVLCNRHYRAIFPELGLLLHSGTRFADLIRAAAETGVIAEAVTDPEAWIAMRQELHGRENGQFQQMLSDGRWIQISDRRTDDGGHVTTVSDITHFKRLEESQLEGMSGPAGLLARTVASVAHGVAVFDQQSRLVTWNSQAATLLKVPYFEVQPGQSVGELLRKVWAQRAALPAKLRQEVRSWISDKNSRTPLRVELIFPGDRCVVLNFRDMPHDGFVVTMTDVSKQLRAARLLEQSKEQLEIHVEQRTQQLLKLNGVLQDEVRRHRETTADLERMRATAEAANLSKTRFLAAASHDLLQPLNSARLYLSALETSPYVEPGGRELIDNIAKSFASIETLLNALLEISKMDAGGYRTKLSLVSLGDLFDTLQTEFSAQARQKGVELRVVPSSVSIYSDTRLLRSIVQNLLSNAIKYSDRGGRVLVGVRHRKAGITVEIIDNGPGIAIEDQAVVFEEFRRLRQPTGVQPPGLGLGLATARRAASLLGCKLSVHSAVGRGSRFILSVPSGQLHTRWNALDGANDDAPVRLATTPGDDRYMLILENDEAVAGAMGMLFDQWRHRSIVAPSYSRMLGAVLGTGIMPKMIIADLHLDEDVDGIDAVVRLRNDLKMDIPAALVTAEQSREIQERAKANNIEYFSKPLKPAQLRAYLLHLEL
ncbi:PAS-domain containing protein [Aquamicrobium sp. cd-1]|uniref:histidine kinase n=2 Tax=Aquamicrobium zhengzhouense TaxID=2781738 RepID=A0ABS0SDE0_9HYPH|nr:PAS-domain containing protein [Aquamicrobium zhengzhouense]